MYNYFKKGKGNMEKMDKKNDNTFDIKHIIMIVTVLIVIIALVFLIKGCSSEDSNSSNNEGNTIKKIGASEEDIVKSYGTSKQDAINVVKSIYNSDNFEFSAEINEDSKYIVSVKNTITNKVEKYLVDPTSNNSFYLITE